MTPDTIERDILYDSIKSKDISRRISLHSYKDNSLDFGEKRKILINYRQKSSEEELNPKNMKEMFQKMEKYGLTRSEKTGYEVLRLLEEQNLEERSGIITNRFLIRDMQEKLSPEKSIERVNQDQKLQAIIGFLRISL